MQMYVNMCLKLKAHMLMQVVCRPRIQDQICLMCSHLYCLKQIGERAREREGGGLFSFKGYRVLLCASH